MTLRFALLTALAAASTVLPQESSAQLRPTLDAQEQRSDAIEAALCAAADTRGDSYRPLFCDPTCTCPVQTASAAGCTEISPGTFVIEGTTQFDPTCYGLCFTCTDVDPSFGNCIAFDLEGSPCTSDVECQGGGAFPGLNVCSYVDPLSGDPIATCVDLAQNPPCASSADCPAGYTCGLFGRCFSSCSDPSDVCPAGSLSPPTLATLAGVTDPNDLAVVDCTVEPTTTEINNVDAAQCIAEVETAIGQNCTPAN